MRLGLALVCVLLAVALVCAQPGAVVALTRSDSLGTQLIARISGAYAAIRQRVCALLSLLTRFTREVSVAVDIMHQLSAQVRYIPVYVLADAIAPATKMLLAFGASSALNALLPLLVPQALAYVCSAVTTTVLVSLASPALSVLVADVAVQLMWRFGGDEQRSASSILHGYEKIRGGVLVITALLCVAFNRKLLHSAFVYVLRCRERVF